MFEAPFENMIVGGNLALEHDLIIVLQLRLRTVMGMASTCAAACSLSAWLLMQEI